jgi:hypothetical protein
LFCGHQCLDGKTTSRSTTIDLGEARNGSSRNAAIGDGSANNNGVKRSKEDGRSYGRIGIGDDIDAAN